MRKNPYLVLGLFVLVLLSLLPTDGMSNVIITNADIYQMIVNGRCTEARALIQNASNRNEFLDTGEGKLYYAHSLCYSPPDELNLKDISNALAHVHSAIWGTGWKKSPLFQWGEEVRTKCEILRQQIARAGWIAKVSEYSGKIMGGCGENPSDAFLPWQHVEQSEEGILKQFSWEPVVPLIEDNVVSQGKIAAPPQELVARVSSNHTAKGPKVSVCAPFIVVSSDDPKKICNHVQRFYDYFRHTFKTIQVGAWVVIHHYTNKKELSAHVTKHGGPGCGGTLGYYDWRRQTIAFWANSGNFGTLQHEMAHAFMFWDIPLAPRWFEEGIAGLFENTDNSFRGLPNPWREKVLTPVRNRVNAYFLESVINMSVVEFERNPLPATVSREVLMNIQNTRSAIPLLPRFYSDIASRARRTDTAPENQIRGGYDRNNQYWRETVMKYVVIEKDPNR